MKKIVWSVLVIFIFTSCNFNYDFVSNPIQDFEIPLNREIAKIKVEEFIEQNKAFIIEGKKAKKALPNQKVPTEDTVYMEKLGKSDIWYYFIEIKDQDSIRFAFKIMGVPENQFCQIRLTSIGTRKGPITEGKIINKAVDSFEEKFVIPFKQHLQDTNRESDK